MIAKVSTGVIPVRMGLVHDCVVTTVFSGPRSIYITDVLKIIKIIIIEEELTVVTK